MPFKPVMFHLTRMGFRSSDDFNYIYKIDDKHTMHVQLSMYNDYTVSIWLEVGFVSAYSRNWIVDPNDVVDTLEQITNALVYYTKRATTGVPHWQYELD